MFDELRNYTPYYSQPARMLKKGEEHNYTGFGYEEAGEILNDKYHEWTGGANFWCNDNGKCCMAVMMNDGTLGIKTDIPENCLERVRLMKN